LPIYGIGFFLYCGKAGNNIFGRTGKALQKMFSRMRDMFFLYAAFVCERADYHFCTLSNTAVSRISMSDLFSGLSLHNLCRSNRAALSNDSLCLYICSSKSNISYVYFLPKRTVHHIASSFYREAFCAVDDLSDTPCSISSSNISCWTGKA
jgi:hypothetical protein